MISQLLSLRWNLRARCKKRHESTVGGRLDKEAAILNRVFRRISQGLDHEADPRQAKRLTEELDLEGEGVKGVVTPNVSARQASEEKDLLEREHTRCRGLAARANYLAAGCPDIIVAAKEICRLMAEPTDVARCSQEAGAVPPIPSPARVSDTLPVCVA